MGDDAGTDAVDDRDDVDLPAWLEDRAAEADIPREDLLDAAVAVYRAAETDGRNPQSVLDRLDKVESRMSTLDAELDEKIKDVRARVLQVKELAESGGDSESVEELEDDLADVREQQQALEAELESVTEELERFDDGFDNYESVLENLSETSRRLEARLDTLARVLRKTRDTVDRVAGEQSERTQMESLAEAANRAGVRTARCEACSASLDIALLTRPACPDCGTTFADVEPAQGFFGSATLTTGSPPALAPGEEERSDPIETMERDPPTDQ